MLYLLFISIVITLYSYISFKKLKTTCNKKTNSLINELKKEQLIYMKNNNIDFQIADIKNETNIKLNTIHTDLINLHFTTSEILKSTFS